MAKRSEVLGPLWIVAKKVGHFNLDQGGAVFLGRRNGPSSQEPGFGSSSLVTTAVTTHGGAIDRSWDPAAVIVEMVLLLQTLLR
jgi:hypothetical protein